MSGLCYVCYIFHAWLYSTVQPFTSLSIAQYIFFTLYIKQYKVFAVNKAKYIFMQYIK